MMARYFMLLALLPAFALLSAQEIPERVSDFNYGLTGQSILDGVSAVDNKLYGIFSQFYGDDAVGLLSRIDTETGAPTPVLDPDLTSWFAGFAPGNIPSVFSVEDMTFAIQRDLASGSNLYHIDENDEATLLLSKERLDYSEMVEFEGEYYFVASSFPLSQTPTQFDSQVAELWKTDGTLEGTVVLDTLFSFFNSSFTHLVAGENSIMISLVNDNDQVFYIYDVRDDELGVLGEGFSQLILPLAIFPRRFEPIAFYDKAFYTFGRIGGQFNNQILRIDEESFEITRINLPAVPDPFFVFEIYDQIDFVTFQDSLYFFAGRSSTGNGIDLYQIQGQNGTELEGLLVNGQTQGRFLIEDDYLSVIEGDTLFFLNRRPETDLALYAYSSGMTEPVVRAILDGPGTAEEDYQSYWLNVDEGHFYASSKNNGGKIFRLNRTTGVLDSADFNFSSFLPPPINPLVTANGNLFFLIEITENNPRGLYRWAPDEAAPSLFGDFIPSGSRPVPQLDGYGESFNFLSLRLDGTVLFDPTDDSVLPLSDSRYSDVGVSSFVGKFGANLYYLAESIDVDTTGRPLLQLEGNQATPVALSSTDLDINNANYIASSTSQLNDSILIFRLQPMGEDSPRRRVLGKVTADGLEVSTLLPSTALGEGLYSRFTNGGFYLDYIDEAGEGQTRIYDEEANLMATLPTDASRVPRGVNQTGVFVEAIETIDGITPENSFLFFPFDDLDNPERLSFTDAVPSTFNRTFYVINQHLVFTAISQSVGMEWHVATPGTGSIVPLADVNPGTSNGTIFPFAFAIGDTLLFTANDGVHGNELWITYGTPESTRLLADIFPGEASSNASNYYLAGNTLFFSANGPQGYEVYRMGVNSLTPELIINLHADDGDSHPYDFTLAGEDFYFLGREAVGTTYELYRIAFELVPTDAEPTRLAAKVFPNPLREQPLNITAPEGEEFERLQLFNQQGQLLREIAGNGSTGQHFSLENLPSGTYWLRSWYTSGKFSINAVQWVR